MGSAPQTANIPGNVVSGEIASGSVGHFHLSDAAVESGNVASGSIGSFHPGSGQAFLHLEASGAYALRNAVNAQRLSVYGTFTDDSNYERVSLRTSGGNGATLITETAGTGADDLHLAVRTAGNGQVQLWQGNTTLMVLGGSLNDGTWNLSRTGNHLTPGSDNAQDVGSVSGRPRFSYAVTQVAQAQGFLANCSQDVSGVIAVAWDSGSIGVVPAQRTSGLRLPAVGVVLGSHLSGALATVITRGLVTTTNSGAVASGFAGRPLYVGSGGLVINFSGFMDGASSGHGAAPTAAGSGYSGALVQPLGLAISGGVYVQLGEVRSGLLSGLLGQF